MKFLLISLNNCTGWNSSSFAAYFFRVGSQFDVIALSRMKPIWPGRISRRWAVVCIPAVLMSVAPFGFHRAPPTDTVADYVCLVVRLRGITLPSMTQRSAPSTQSHTQTHTTGRRLSSPVGFLPSINTREFGQVAGSLLGTRSAILIHLSVFSSAHGLIAASSGQQE